MDQRDFNELKRDLEEILAKAHDMYTSINVPALEKELAELEKETLKENFWQDKERFAETNQNISKLKRTIEPWKQLIQDMDETAELVEMSMAESDSDLLEEIETTVTKLSQTFQELETRELFSEEDDIRNAFITIHPGAGGTESQDWAHMLARMYTRWAEKNSFSMDVFDYTPGEEAGIKSATLLVKGEYAFGLLKGEMGIHRLVRISPFDSNKRRHTSFASVEIVPEITDEVEIEVRDADLKIDTYRASGAGGQHVNKTDSAVRITHIPSGIVVQCQNERSQHKNKAFAMKVLKARLYEQQKLEQEAEKQGKIGEKKDISWGNQIRSYVFQPYTMVKDHRTNEETGSIDFVFDGDINRFIYAYLKSLKSGEKK